MEKSPPSLMDLNLAKSPLDSASAMEAKGLEHLAILTISTWQPRPAATVAKAVTRVVHNGQEVL